METDNRARIGYLFTVDVLIEDTDNAAALQTLLQMLRSPKLKDIKIQKGMELGSLIDAVMQDKDTKKRELAKSDLEPAKAEWKKSAPDKKAPDAKRTETKPSEAKKDILYLIEQYKTNNTLIRLSIVKGKGVNLSIPGRIVNFDEKQQIVTIYHVDEKKVYQFALNEIDDLVVH